MELQNARTTVMGVGNYSVPIDIVKHLSVCSIEAFRPLSTMWHRFLGLDGKQAAQQETSMGNIDLSRRPKRRERSGDDRGDKEPSRGLVLQQSNEKEKAVRKAMQQVLGQQDVGFRSAEQELALHAVVDRQTPLVVVLPTSGGKSLLFSVPACMDDAGVTVVVVPYQALINYLVNHMQKRGIDCIEWKHGESSPAAVVVVSADVAGIVANNQAGLIGLIELDDHVTGLSSQA
jgi:hypothetical protein